ncbi:MAG: divergent polysaccharide deacetylase family protein [Pseudomonadota bacterium]
MSGEKADTGKSATAESRAGPFGWSFGDICVVGLAAICIAIPVAHVMSDARIGPVVKAQRSVIISGADTQTIWPSGDTKTATQAATPQWAQAQLNRGKRLSATLALATAATEVELDAAPLWSPHIASLEPQRVFEDDSLTDYVQLASMETGAIGAYLRGAPRWAPRPSEKPRDIVVQRRPQISIVLTAVGINEDASRAAIAQLPIEVTFAIAPVGASPGDWAAASRRDGRVTLLEMPMEPLNFPRVNPGPLTLLTSADPDDNLDRLQRAINKVGRIDGVSTYLGGRFRTNAAALRPIVRDLREREVFVFENGDDDGSKLGAVANSIGVPISRAPIRLDKSGRSTDISAELKKLERQARRDGFAVGVAVAVPSTVDALAEWARVIEDRGFWLTPLRP